MYKSYLLRLWRDGPTTPWRGMLAGITSAHEPRYFATLDELVAYLLTEMAEGTRPATAAEPEGES